MDCPTIIYRPIIFLIIIWQPVKLVIEGGGFSSKQMRMFFFFFSFSRFIKYRNGSEKAYFFLQEDLR